jgi:SAM-dependent methyltransferase
MSQEAMTGEHEPSPRSGGRRSPGTDEIMPLATQLSNSTEAEHSLIAVNHPNPSHKVTAPHSTYDSDASNSDTTLDSDCHEIRRQHGRIYHFRATSKTLYPLPIDRTELDRQGVLHVMYKDTLDGELSLAPVGDARMVLDLGTGRGEWANDFAHAHPNAKVYGTDLSPIQIARPWENCFFQVDDFEEEWTWYSPFDFVHGRDLLPAVSNWPRLLGQVFKHLVPGGYIELQNQVFPLRCYGSPTRPDLELMEWSGGIMKSYAGQPYNIRLAAAAEIEDLLKSEGFVNVHSKRFQWKLHTSTNNQQEKTFSQNVCKVLLEGLDAYSRRPYLEDRSLSNAQYDASLRHVRRAIKEEETSVYITVDVVYAQKPDLDDSSDLRDRHSRKSLVKKKSDRKLQKVEKQSPQKAKTRTRTHELPAQTIIPKIGSASNSASMAQDGPGHSGTWATESFLSPVCPPRPAEEFHPPDPHHQSGYHGILWYGFRNGNELLAKLADRQLAQYLAVDVAEQWGLTTEEVDRSL